MLYVNTKRQGTYENVEVRYVEYVLAANVQIAALQHHQNCYLHLFSIAIFSNK